VLHANREQQRRTMTKRAPHPTPRRECARPLPKKREFSYRAERQEATSAPRRTLLPSSINPAATNTNSAAATKSSPPATSHTTDRSKSATASRSAPATESSAPSHPAAAKTSRASSSNSYPTHPNPDDRDRQTVLAANGQNTRGASPGSLPAPIAGFRPLPGGAVARCVCFICPSRSSRARLGRATLQAESVSPSRVRKFDSCRGGTASTTGNAVAPGGFVTAGAHAVQ